MTASPRAGLGLTVDDARRFVQRHPARTARPEVFVARGNLGGPSRVSVDFRLCVQALEQAASATADASFVAGRHATTSIGAPASSSIGMENTRTRRALSCGSDAATAACVA
jgi:hypothetical protein